MAISLIDVADNILVEAAKRVSKRIDRIEQIKDIPKEQLEYSEVDTDSRVKRYIQREKRFREDDDALATDPGSTDEVGQERMIGTINDILSIEFLEAGVEAGKAVGKLDYANGTECGTGFFICPELILTNHHVIPDPYRAAETVFELFDESNQIGEPRIPVSYYLDPDRFFLTSKDLDYTVVAIESGASTDQFGWLPLLAEQGKILIGHSVNIIQHPQGKAKMVVLQNSRLLDIVDNGDATCFCWYEADTERGSSGSPVFNNRWEIIALHHKAVPKQNVRGEILDINGRTMSKERYQREPHLVNWIANEGIRASRIVKSIANEALPDQAQLLLRNRLLSLWENPRSRRPGLKTGWLD